MNVRRNKSYFSLENHRYQLRASTHHVDAFVGNISNVGFFQMIPNASNKISNGNPSHLTEKQCTSQVHIVQVHVVQVIPFFKSTRRHIRILIV